MITADLKKELEQLGRTVRNVKRELDKIMKASEETSKRIEQLEDDVRATSVQAGMSPKSR